MKIQSDAADADVGAGAYGDDGVDGGAYFLVHQNQMPRRNLDDDVCVCFYFFSDAYHYLSFPMDLPRNALASFSCVSSLFFSSSHRQKMIHFLHHLLFLHSVKETALSA